MTALWWLDEAAHLFASTIFSRLGTTKSKNKTKTKQQPPSSSPREKQTLPSENSWSNGRVPLFCLPIIRRKTQFSLSPYSGVLMVGR